MRGCVWVCVVCVGMIVCVGGGGACVCGGGGVYVCVGGGVYVCGWVCVCGVGGCMYVGGCVCVGWVGGWVGGSPPRSVIQDQGAEYLPVTPHG